MYVCARLRARVRSSVHLIVLVRSEKNCSFAFDQLGTCHFYPPSPPICPDDDDDDDDDCNDGGDDPLWSHRIGKHSAAFLMAESIHNRARGRWLWRLATSEEEEEEG